MDEIKDELLNEFEFIYPELDINRTIFDADNSRLSVFTDEGVFEIDYNNGEILISSAE